LTPAILAAQAFSLPASAALPVWQPVAAAVEPREALAARAAERPVVVEALVDERPAAAVVGAFAPVAAVAVSAA
jgi:hypothetical protein